MRRKLIGLLRLIYHLSQTKTRKVLDDIVEEMFFGDDYSKGNFFVLMVGYSLSGKKSFVENHPQLRRFFSVSSAEVHNFLNERLLFMQDDFTVTGEAYWERQYLTRLLRKRVLKGAFRRGFKVVNVSANLVRRERSGRLRIARRYGYRTVIIWLNVCEQVLLKSLLNADIDSVGLGGKAVWLDLYHLVQKGRFQSPLYGEAGELIVVTEETDPGSVILEPR